MDHIDLRLKWRGLHDDYYPHAGISMLSPKSSSQVNFTGWLKRGRNFNSFTQIIVSSKFHNRSSPNDYWGDEQCKVEIDLKMANSLFLGFNFLWQLVNFHLWSFPFSPFNWKVLLRIPRNLLIKQTGRKPELL